MNGKKENWKKTKSLIIFFSFSFFIKQHKKLQELRLDILRLRNNLAKNKKILKKKEELAEGLHLIDFEQLKIENQVN